MKNQILARALGAGLAANLLLAASAESPPFGTLFLEAGNRPFAIEQGDFNGDGVVDLATLHDPLGEPGGVSLSVYIGRGDGTFEPRRSISGTDSRFFLAGDFDGDGTDELVARAPGEASNSDQYSVYGLDKAGDLVVRRTQTLSVGASAGASNLPRALGGDFNGDGRDDVALLLEDRATFNVFLGFPGGLDQATELAPGGVTGAISAAIAEDLDGDGSVEIVTAHDEHVRVWSWDDGSMDEIVALEFDDRIDQLAAGEIDGAPGADLLAGEHEGGYLLEYAVLPDVLAGTARGAIELDNEIFGEKPYFFDENGDGLDDLLVLDVTGVSVVGPLRPELSYAYVASNVSGVFPYPAFGETPRLGLYPADAVVADFNADGRPDIAAVNAHRDNGTVTIVLGQGAGAFGNVDAVDNRVGLGLPGARFIDLDADGYPDVVFDGEVHLNEQGRFALEADAQLLSEYGGAANGVFADLDGDGDVDQYILEDGFITAFINDAGVFTAQAAHELATTDEEQDDYGPGAPISPGGGASVLVATRPKGSESSDAFNATVLEYLGAGVFSETRVSFNLPYVIPIRVVDFDGDGLGDIQWSGFEPGLDSLDRYIWLNDAGAFLPDATPYGQTGVTPGFERAIFDLSGDGLADRVMIDGVDLPSGVEWSVRIELQQADGAFVASQAFVTAAEKGVAMTANIGRVVHEDLTGDGVADLCVLYTVVDEFFGYAVVVYEGLGAGVFGQPLGIVAGPIGGSSDFGFDVADADLDGDVDILLGGDWFMNPPSLNNSPLVSGVLYNRTNGVKASCFGDLNGDGRVGPADLARVLAAWGHDEAEFITYDLYPDGVIDATDIAALIAEWGDCD